MSYDSVEYLFIFLPVVIFCYALTPKKLKWITLLIASYTFFFMFSGKLLGYLIATTLSIYMFAIGMERFPNHKKKICIIGIIVQLGMLGILKYTNFTILNMNEIFKLLHLPVHIEKMKWLLPIGISFYTMQAVSYLIDVHRKKLSADHHLGRLALYLAFFPQIMEGPIARYEDSALSLHEGKQITYLNLTYGAQRILWGMFKKLVIADRLNALVKTVFDGYEQYSGIIIVIAALFYTIQLYADFSGCIDITLGSAEIFGIKLPENFRQPFFSKTVSEFWRRWHITLGTWFKDYVFYPVTLSKKMKKIKAFFKGHFGKQAGKMVPAVIALFAVWMCNGLWHGPKWTYIFFGFYYFVLIAGGTIAAPWFKQWTIKHHINTSSKRYYAMQITRTFLFVIVGELFFRATSLNAGFHMIASIFDFNLTQLWNGQLLSLGMDELDFLVIIVAIVIVLFVDILHEKRLSVRDLIASKPIAIRWTIYYAAILIVIIFGAYGGGYVAADIMYADF